MKENDHGEYFEQDEDMEEIIEEEIKIGPLIREFTEKSKTVILGNSIESGSGELIGLKIALQSIDCMLVASGKVSLLGKYPLNQIDTSFVNSPNPAATASGLSRTTGKKVLVYADDVTTLSTFQSILKAAENHENFIYICYNTQKYKNVDIKKSFFYKLLKKSSYAATASISHPEDYINKLEEADSAEGFRFIELLTPSPIDWEFDRSNTIEVAKLAVNSKFWLLLKKEEKNRLQITFEPSEIENVETYLSMQKTFSSLYEKEEINKVIQKNWLFVKG